MLAAVAATVTGIDGCKGGWVAVTLGAPGVRVTAAATLAALGIDGLAGIDMPLGLPAVGWRTADLLARRALGRRGSCVFAIPPRPVWAAPDYPTANLRCRELTGGGLSAQAWGLRAKLLEADQFRRGCAHPLYEVHPELSFAGLAGAPLRDSKHSAAGRTLRRVEQVVGGVERAADRRRHGGRADRPGAAGRRRVRDRNPVLTIRCCHRTRFTVAY